jgi:hypothetical protein
MPPTWNLLTHAGKPNPEWAATINDFDLIVTHDDYSKALTARGTAYAALNLRRGDSYVLVASLTIVAYGVPVTLPFEGPAEWTNPPDRAVEWAENTRAAESLAARAVEGLKLYAEQMFGSRKPTPLPRAKAVPAAGRPVAVRYEVYLNDVTGSDDATRMVSDGWELDGPPVPVVLGDSWRFMQRFVRRT